MPDAHARLPDRADVVVIGGGITGCATAYYLARERVSVVLLERGEIAGAQSSRAWGFIRQQGRHPAEVPYAAQASRIWEGLSGELQADLEFVRGGILVPAQSEEDEERMRHGARIAAEHGLSSRLVGRPELSRLIPQLEGDYRAALYTAEDAHGEPRKATEAFAQAAERHGAQLFAGVAVRGFRTSAGRVSAVLTPDGEIQTDRVVCAAGLGTASLVRQLGWSSLPIHGMRISVAETEPVRPFTRMAVWAPQVAFRPTGRDTFYVGSGYRGKVADIDLTLDAVRHARYFLPRLKDHLHDVKLRVGGAMLRSLLPGDGAAYGREPEPNRSIVRYNMEQFLRCFPHLAGLGVKRSWAGIVDITPDMLPVIGPVPGRENVVVAAGFSGHGFALGPASGKVLSALATDRPAPFDLAPFRLTRFAEGDFAASPEAL